MMTSRYSKLNYNLQRGIGMLIMLVFLLSLIITGYILQTLLQADIKAERYKKTAAALSEAKAALIAYAITSENSTTDTQPRPGNFPCPDTDAPGTTQYGSEQPSCSANNRGRIPWKTLGVSEDLVKDGDGEVLWYTVASSFRKANSNSNPINSDTKGTKSVYASDAVTSLTPAGDEGVVVLFSPGAPINTQNRSSNAQKVAVANYLESVSGYNNASTAGPYIAGAKSSSFNDQVLIIKTQDFMPTIEKRVATELKARLQAYYTTNSVFPYPARSDNCTSSLSCTSDINSCRGRIPSTALPVDWGGTANLPTWFFFNQWYRTIYYTVGTAYLSTAPASCSSQITLGAANVKSLFFTPGKPLGSLTRPNNTLSRYLEDLENNDGWNITANDIYVIPSASSNDTVYSFP